MSDDWDGLLPASFAVAGFPTVVFPVWQQIEAVQSLREVAREVPWIDGELIDDTGTTAEVWTTSIPFYNDIQLNEEGLGLTPALYPDRLELLWKICKAKKTGTLNLPFRRNIRAKACQWRRIAVDDRRGGEVLQIRWKEDNEARLDGPSSDGMAVQANLRHEVTEAVFEAERAGLMADGGFEGISRLASQVEAALNQPSEAMQDLKQKAKRLTSACDSIINSFSSRTPGRNAFRDPDGERAHRRLFRVRMLAARAESEARAAGKRIQTRRFAASMSLLQIAVLVGQDFAELLTLNPQIEDPNWIQRGTPVIVLQD
jgi:hypothetical protein